MLGLPPLLATAAILALLVLVAPADGQTPVAPGQDPERRRWTVDAHFDDRGRTLLTVEATAYTLTVDLRRPRIVRFANRCGAAPEASLLDGGALELAVRTKGGGEFLASHAPHPARLNIWRHGLAYYEVHVLDIQPRDAAGQAAPVSAEIVLYCFPDKVHIEGALYPGMAPTGGGKRPTPHRKVAEGVDVEAAGLVLTGPAGERVAGALRPAGGRLGGSVAEVVEGGAATALYLPSARAGRRLAGGVAVADHAPGAWTAGERRSAWCVALPTRDEPAACAAALAAETSPLGRGAFRVTAGGVFEGYDRVRGVYVLRTAMAPAPAAFEPHWVNPNEYQTVEFRVTNDATPRRITVEQTSVNGGTVEAAVVCDALGWPMPIPVQTCKNFGSEMEEPDDTAFSESYFPLKLEPRQTLALRSMHLFQNWGKRPLKQISSIRFFEHYWHMSTGVTETTCHVPFTKPAYKDQGYNVPDFRGMSGVTWLGQPQHHHVALHGFLQYNDGKWHYLRYLGSALDYVAPCFAQFTTRYVTEDGKVRATVRIFEAPQTDETRTFTRVRYDVDEPVQIAGDARQHLKLFTASTDITRNPYHTLAWTGPDGKVVTRGFAYDDSWPALGEPLGLERPMTCLYASDRSNNAYVVLRYAGRLGGKPVERLAVSLAAYRNGVNDHLLTLPDATVRLEKGDWFEADVILLPYGDDTSDWRTPEKERTWYGANAPRITVHRGAKVADFPATVRAENGVAELTLEGGHNVLPIVVQGMPDYRAPMLWEEAGGVWQWVDPQVWGKDGYQVQDGPDGNPEFVFLMAQRNGMTHRYLVTQAWAEKGIARITQRNHCPRVEAASAGALRLVGPRLYVGLEHAIAPGDPAIVATGHAKVAVAAPMAASAEGGAVRLRLERYDASGIAFAAEGTGLLSLRLEGLLPGRRYRVEGVEAPPFEPDRDGRGSARIPLRGAAKVRIAPAR